MKKRLLFMAAAASVAVMATAGELTPKYCLLGMSEFEDGFELIKPFTGCEFVFGQPVAAANDAVAVVMCDDVEVLRTSAFDIVTYSEDNCSVWLDFEETNLPKGKEYALKLPANSLYATAETEAKNAEVSVTFSVPRNLNGYFGNITGQYDRQTNQWKSVEVKLSINVVATVENPEFILYRNGEEINRYEMTLTHVYYPQSECSVVFNPPLTLTDADNYTLVLPAGSVGAQYRQDITNADYEIVLQHGDQSAINEIKTNSTPGNQTYDLMGRRVKCHTRRGIYIVNGHKITR